MKLVEIANDCCTVIIADIDVAVKYNVNVESKLDEISDEIVKFIEFVKSKNNAFNPFKDSWCRPFFT